MNVAVRIQANSLRSLVKTCIFTRIQTIGGRWRNFSLVFPGPTLRDNLYVFHVIHGRLSLAFPSICLSPLYVIPRVRVTFRSLVFYSQRVHAEEDCAPGTSEILRSCGTCWDAVAPFPTATIFEKTPTFRYENNALKTFTKKICKTRKKSIKEKINYYAF